MITIYDVAKQFMKQRCKLNVCFTIIIVSTITTVFFNQSAYNIEENIGVIQLVLVLSNPLLTDITIQVTDYADTATGGQLFAVPEMDQDYTIETHAVTFTAGTTIAALNVTINDDKFDESDEKFTLTIDPYSLPIDGITIVYPYQTTVTIMDDDRKWTTILLKG